MKKGHTFRNMKKLLFAILLCCTCCSAWAAADYTSIDKYAYEAPPLQTSTGLSRLVRYLIRPYKTDEEKARVILAWIVHNIDYDEYKMNAIDDSLDRTKKKDKELYIDNSDILATRTGVCSDIAQLYQKMGTYAGLDVAIIKGKAGKNMTYAELKGGAEHVWNAVRINRQWEYVDPTWAISGKDVKSFNDTSTRKDYKKEIRQRSQKASDAKMPREGRVVDNKWFLTDKDEMIKTHFPYDEKWQLQKKKMTEKDFLGLDNKAYIAAQTEYEISKRKNIR